MRNTVRLKRLHELKYMLENHSKLFKEVKFDIQVWGQSKGNYSDTMPQKCNTAACALGSAALHAPFKKAGLISLIDRYGIGEIRYKGETDQSAGQKFFGLTYPEASSLFDPGEYDSEHPRPATVAKRVQGLIEHYTRDSEPS